MTKLSLPHRSNELRRREGAKSKISSPVPGGDVGGLGQGGFGPRGQSLRKFQAEISWRQSLY